MRREAAVRRSASNQRLALALLGSGLAHALLIAGGPFALERESPPAAPLAARLAPAPPPPAPAAVEPPARALAAARARARVVTAAAGSYRPPVLAEPELAAAEPEPSVGAEAPEPAAPEPLAAPAAPELPAPAPAAVPSFPRRGRIAYALLYGEERSPVGRAVQSWEIEDGAYRLAAEAETTGLIELFRPQRLRYLSQGRVTPEGLKPESFTMSRMRRGRHEVAQARFDWNAGHVTYGSARERRTAALPADASDLLAFIYQLALAPPAPGRLQLPLATGTHFESFEIEVREEEPIETPLGTVRALPVRQRPRAGSESIEVWLAAEYRYLPVRIRYYGRDGEPAGEQLAREIQVSEE